MKKAEIVVIGGGFIGIEFADEINKAGDKNVTVIEIAPHFLAVRRPTSVSLPSPHPRPALRQPTCTASGGKT